MTKEPRYQLLRKSGLGPVMGEPPRWQFIAHGAPYTAKEAEEMRKLVEAKGDKFTRLRI
jgi:hypothetical protein